jgi:hypothetical protein
MCTIHKLFFFSLSKRLQVDTVDLYFYDHHERSNLSIMFGCYIKIHASVKLIIKQELRLKTLVESNWHFRLSRVCVLLQEQNVTFVSLFKCM